MSRTCSLRFVQNFLFSDNNNHKEFLKRIQRLDKDDGLLLVTLLERVATGDGITPLASVQRIGDFDPQSYNGIDPGAHYFPMPNNATEATGKMTCHKHPLRIAEAYVGAKGMAKHTLNIFEVAYLNPLREAKRWHVLVAITCFLVQWSLLAILIFYDIFDQKAMVNYSEGEAHFLLIFVAFGSSVVFLHKFMLEGGKCMQFAQTYLKMTPPQLRYRFWPNFPLILDFGVNIILGLLVFLFNIYFILISDNANDAILNALALFFIVEIDDDLTPDMDDDEVEDFKAVKLLKHILQPLEQGESLTVKKVTEMDVEPRTGPGCYEDDDILYINVGECEVAEGSAGRVVRANVVSVWKADDEGKSSHELTTSFSEVKYIVGGSKAKEFCEALAEFRCIQNWKDISS
mmetsp:Transcript_25409/g.74810  ORF Transcript_25409/g.74810 Transcript_25409/m.74810 type:complete len:402 (-) Transcript_25409:215-1420(-)